MDCVYYFASLVLIVVVLWGFGVINFEVNKR